MTDVLLNAGILGTGSYVPPQLVTNEDLAQRIDTSDEWIKSRTGIERRHIAAPNVCTSDLALEAAKNALANANVAPEELDLIILATCTPDHPGSFPSTATVVQHKLGAVNAGAFDLGAVCSGFSYALHVGAQMVRSGSNRKVLVIGAETMSRILNWNDRNTAVLFGDGAGAVVLGIVEEGGYLGGKLWANGQGGQYLNIPAGGSRMPLTAECLESAANTIYQNGREVYRFAVNVMGEAAVEVVSSLGLSTSDIDCFIPHQANVRIISSAADRMGLPIEKVFINVQNYGNTSAASIPLALDQAVQAGSVKKGNLVVTVGFGGGLTWAANVIRWCY